MREVTKKRPTNQDAMPAATRHTTWGAIFARRVFRELDRVACERLVQDIEAFLAQLEEPWSTFNPFEAAVLMKDGTVLRCVPDPEGHLSHVTRHSACAPPSTATAP